MHKFFTGMRPEDPKDRNSRNFDNGSNLNWRGIFLFVVFTSVVLGLFLFSRNGNYRSVDGPVVSNEHPTVSILYGNATANQQVVEEFFPPNDTSAFAITPTADRFVLRAGGDTFVLQASFNPQDPYVIQTGASNMRLMWVDPSTQTLENAGLANTGNSKPHFKLDAFDPKTAFHLGTNSASDR